jgi:hypothetical protein
VGALMPCSASRRRRSLEQGAGGCSAEQSRAGGWCAKRRVELSRSKWRLNLGILSGGRVRVCMGQMGWQLGNVNCRGKSTFPSGLTSQSLYPRGGRGAEIKLIVLVDQSLGRTMDQCHHTLIGSRCVKCMMVRSEADYPG